MRTRSQTRNRNRQQQSQNRLEVNPFHLEEPFVNPPLVLMADNRTMAQLLQAPTEGYEDAIVIPEINANFELKHGSARIWLEKEPPRSILTWDDLVSKFINQFFPPSKTTNLRNEITRFQQRFDESFYEAWDRFNDLLRACPHHGFSELHQLDTFYNALNANDQDSLNSAAGGNFLDKMPRECLRIIESKSKVRNSRNKTVVTKVILNSSTPGISPDVAALTTEVSELKNMMKTMLIDKQKAQAPAPVKAVEQSCVTYGGAHSYRNCPATDGNVNRDNIQEYVSQAATGNFNQGNTNPRQPSSTLGTLPSNTILNPKGEIKAITTRSGVTYEGPSIPTNPSPKKVVKRETEETTDKEQTNFQRSTAQIPPPNIPISILEPDVLTNLPKTTPIPEFDIPKNLPKPNIPYPSRRDDQKSCDKASNQMKKIFQIFQDLRFDISFTDALLLMPRFAPTIKSLLMNKEKLLELAKIPLNENCSAMLLKKLPEKLGDPGKFLIPCNFPGMDITRPKGLAEDIFVKVGNFHFPTDFVVVDFEADPRVPLILGRSFLRTSHALIDVYEGELVLRDENEQITFHVNGTSKHPQKHENESIKMVNGICKNSFKRFPNEPALVYPPPSEDVNNEKEKQEVKNLAEPTAKRQTRITPCLKNFKVICKESIFHSKPPQVSSVFAITSTLPSIEPKDSLIMGDDHLSTFSTEENVPIPRESKETSRSDSKNVLPSCDDFSSINVPRDDSVTFSNPLFEFNVNFHNPLFDEELEDIECKDSYDSNLDKSTFLVTPLSDSNKDESLILRDDIEFLLHEDPSTPLKSFETNDEAECFNPGGDDDEIDAFLAIKVPTYIEGYYDSEGDITYLESLLSEDTTHNLSPKVFFDHEPQQLRNEPENEPLITFSPKSDPLHHEFTGELITIPSGISPENFHTIIESLPTSTTLIEDNDPNREEIDIFSGPDDSIPPGIESKFDSEEDIIDNLLNGNPTHERLTFNIKPDALVINNVDELNEDECFDPEGGEIDVEVDNSFTFVTWTFLPFLTYPETLKKKLTEAPILIAPDWDQPFELMCDASDYAIGAVLGQRIEKHF
ncbi:reverse transcriptase domain-containing protein [Tanacetum coccineum]